MSFGRTVSHDADSPCPIKPLDELVADIKIGLINEGFFTPVTEEEQMDAEAAARRIAEVIRGKRP